MAPTVHTFSRLIVLISAIIGLSLTLPCPAFGQETDQDVPSLIQVPGLGTKPLVTVTLTSLERASYKLQALCAVAGCPETADDIILRIDSATDSLAGVDQERPGGVAVYLNSIFPPSLEFVAFVPLTDTDAFLRTLELGPVVSAPVAGKIGRFELLGPTQTIQVRIRNGYAFIQLPIMAPPEDFDRELFDPLKGEFDQFDISVTLDVESIPRGTRNLILSFLTSTMSTQMQQRDEEADGVYEMRRAWMQADIDSFRLLLNECQRITIGLSVDQERRLGIVDFLMDVRENSDLIHEIFNSASKQSYFAPVLDNDSAVSLAVSMVLPDRDRDRYAGVLEGFKKELTRQVTLKDLGPELNQASPVLAGLTALQETFREGHLDAFGQCYDDSRGKLVVVGAVRVLEGETVAAGLTDMLSRLKGMEGLEALQIGYGYGEHAGIRFHRMGLGDSDPERDAILGPNSGVVFGSGPRSMWLGVGGDETMDVISSVMDQLQAAYEKPSQPVRSSSMRIVVNINSLIQLAESAERAQTESRKTSRTRVDVIDAFDGTEESTVDRGTVQRADIGSQDQSRQEHRTRPASWRKTFAEGGDRVRVDFQPLKSGARMRLEFGEAFLKGFGRAIARRTQSDSE